MNDSEFESAVAEGIAALKNARERLKNNPKDRQTGKKSPLNHSSLPLSIFAKNPGHLNGSLGVGLNAAVIFRCILSWRLSPHLKADKT
jgi:hypothetical protein